MAQSNDDILLMPVKIKLNQRACLLDRRRIPKFHGRFVSTIQLIMCGNILWLLRLLFHISVPFSFFRCISADANGFWWNHKQNFARRVYPLNLRGRNVSHSRITSVLELFFLWNPLVLQLRKYSGLVLLLIRKPMRLLHQPVITPKSEPRSRNRERNTLALRSLSRQCLYP